MSKVYKSLDGGSFETLDDCMIYDAICCVSKNISSVVNLHNNKKEIDIINAFFTHNYVEIVEVVLANINIQNKLQEYRDGNNSDYCFIDNLVHFGE